jgi:hypothetical protein
VKKPYALSIAPADAIDSKWYALLQRLDVETAAVGLSTELFSVLGPSVEQLATMRAAYEQHSTAPQLHPQDINIVDLQAAITQLEALLANIKANERNLVIRRAYSQRLYETIAHCKLLVAASQHDGSTYARLNRIIYGSANKQIYAACCAWLREYAYDSSSSNVPSVASCAKAVLDTVPDAQGKAQRIIPKSWIFKRVRDLHFAADGYFEQLLGTGQLPDYIDAHSGDPVVQRAIRAIGSDYHVADAEDGLWGVIHHTSQVVRPPDYYLPRNEFIGIVAHEVGSHLLERLNGERQALRLLELGLDRYGAGNEGRAFLREQIVRHSPHDMMQEASWEYIVLLHLGVSLASGVAGKPLTFDQLYRAIYPICLLFQTIKQPDNPVYAELKARDETWNLLVRVCNGTDGQGGAYHKDIVYLEGNAKIWKLARLNPAIVLYGDVGKFDITRLEHRWILRSLSHS